MKGSTKWGKRERTSKRIAYKVDACVPYLRILKSLLDGKHAQKYVTTPETIQLFHQLFQQPTENEPLGEDRSLLCIYSIFSPP